MGVYLNNKSAYTLYKSEAGRQAQDLFGTLKISASEEYEKHLNQYSVIQISMNELERVWKMLSVSCASHLVENLSQIYEA